LEVQQALSWAALQPECPAASAAALWVALLVRRPVTTLVPSTAGPLVALWTTSGGESEPVNQQGGREPALLQTDRRHRRRDRRRLRALAPALPTASPKPKPAWTPFDILARNLSGRHEIEEEYLAH
jgi:hypothetical protein